MGIVVHVGIGGNVKGAIDYLTEGRRAAPGDKQATLLLAVGLRTSSPEAMGADFELGQQANPDLRQAVWTSSLSFDPTDLEAGRLPPARQLEIMLAFCQKMGVVDTQLVIVLHGDTDKAHVHLVANRVDDRGQTISDNFCQWRAQVKVRELVTEFGLTPGYGNRPELQHPERAVGQPARAEAFIRQGLGYALQQATSRAELRAELAAGGVEMRETERGVSFCFEGIAAKGRRLGHRFSAPAIDRQLEVNQTAQQPAEAKLAQLRTQQLALEAARQERAEAERQSDYGRIATLGYGDKGGIPDAERQIALARQQLAGLPGGPARLAVFDEEVTIRARQAEQARQAAEERAQRQAEQARAEQAQALAQRYAEGAATDVARARREVETHQLALARAIRQAKDPDQLRELSERLQTAERGLTAYQRRAESSDLGQRLLQVQEANEQDRQRAAAVLGPLAWQGGYATLEEFRVRAAPAGYALPTNAAGQVSHVVVQATDQRLALPVVDGWRLDELLADQMQQEQALRQRTQNQLAWLAEAQARAGGRYEGVRVRVAPNQVEQVRQMLGDKAQVDGQAGADGRLGVNILYNANASSR
jgi:hypothetical protein